MRGLQGGRPKKALQYLIEFKLLYANEGVHTLEGGVDPAQAPQVAPARACPMEPALLFYPKFAWNRLRKAWNYWRGFQRAKGVVKQVSADPARWDYLDDAIRPLGDNELKAMDLFHETRGGDEAVAKIEKQDAMIENIRAHEAA